MSSTNITTTQQEVYVCRFVLEGSKKLYLRSLWGKDHFSLYVTDGRYLWHGDATASFIESNMLIRGLEMDNFIRRSKGALIAQDRKYTYKVTQGEKLTDLEFTWFFRLGQTDIMARCMLPLSRVSDGQQAQKAMQHIVDFYVDRRNYLERQNNDYFESNKALTTQRDDALAQFSKLVEDKKNLESELYRKFILVLNEKKQKIRELKDALEHAQTARIERQQQVEDGDEEQQPEENNYQENSSFEDRSGNESDLSPSRRKPKSPHKASSPTQSLTFNSSDKPTPSLDLLDSTDVVVTTTVRRRHRSESQTNTKPPDIAGNGNSNSSSNGNGIHSNNTGSNHTTANHNHANHTNHTTTIKQHQQPPITPTKGKAPANNKAPHSPFSTPSRKRRRADHDTSRDANDLIDELM